MSAPLLALTLSCAAFNSAGSSAGEMGKMMTELVISPRNFTRPNRSSSSRRGQLLLSGP